MFQKLFKYAVKNISRNTFLSISSVIILTLLMFFINILIVLQDVSIRIISSVNERLTISLYLSDEYNKNSVEVIDLQNDINTAIPWIVTTYKSRRSSWRYWKNWPRSCEYTWEAKSTSWNYHHRKHTTESIWEPQYDYWE